MYSVQKSKRILINTNLQTKHIKRIYKGIIHLCEHDNHNKIKYIFLFFQTAPTPRDKKHTAPAPQPSIELSLIT